MSTQGGGWWHSLRMSPRPPDRERTGEAPVGKLGWGEF